MRFLAYVISACVCILTGWMIYQDSLASTKTEPKQHQDEPVPVEAVSVQRQTIDERIDLVGSLETVDQVEVRSRISGYLKSLKYDIGQEVTASEVVVELDDSSHRELVTSAEAAKEVAQAQLDAQIARERQAAREVERLKKLAESGVSTEQQEEQAQSQWTVAKAELELEKARLDQAEAELQRSRLQLEDLSIETPISGHVAERHVDIGDLASPDAVLLRIVNLKTIRTVVHVVERDYVKIKQGQSAEIQVDAHPGRRFPGTVVARAPVLDPETRTARVIIEMQNPELMLRPGMHARVPIIAHQRRRTQVIPIAALQERDGRQFVYVTSDSGAKARQQFISTGIRNEDAIEVLSGIDPDAEVITLGSRLIEDGSPVIVTKADWNLRPPVEVKKAPAPSNAAGD